MSWRLADLASRAGCEFRGDPDTPVSRVATLSNATDDALSFLASDAYKKQLPDSLAAAVVLRPADADEAPRGAILSDNPYATYAELAAVLHPPLTPEPGIHPTAVIASSADVDASASVGPNAVVEDDTVIARNAIIGAGCFVGPGCSVGEGTRLLANVTLIRAVTLGARNLIHSGVVLGSDGFGNAMTPSGWLKVPQVGGLRVGNDVEIGANSAIDCGAVEDSVIEDGVRIDNLVHIAHNVQIGAHTAIAAQVGIAGSTRIGQRCMFAGQAGAVGHVTICDDVIVSGKTAVSKDITEPGVYTGTFVAEKARTWTRRVARFRRLDALAERVKKLEDNS